MTEAPESLATSPKRDAVLKSAIAQFVAYGFDRASIEQIAAGAGVAIQTIYAHFGSKNGLVEAIERECLQSPEDLADFSYDPDSPLDAQLTTFGDAIIRVFISDPYIIMSRIRVARWIDAPDRSGLGFSEQGERFSAPLVEWTLAAARDGRLSVEDPALAASQFLTLLTAVLWPVLVGGRPLSSRRQGQLIGSSVAMFLRLYETKRSYRLAGARRAEHQDARAEGPQQELGT